MQHNIIIAGVGGQGILSIAKAISGAAVERGMHVKQAEVHGMSQRGGAVQSHLRVSDEPIHSDLIPAGRGNVLIAVEPLEALRYVHLLAPDGVVVASANAFANIGNYPPVEQVIDRITSTPRHVVLDSQRLARAAGSTRADNMVMLGAASLFLALSGEDLENAIGAMFAGKGDKVVDSGRRALRLGRGAARAYMSGLEVGGSSRVVRHWIDSLSTDELIAWAQGSGPAFDPGELDDRLSGAEAHAVERLLAEVHESGRRQLFEHEVYQIVQFVGAISPPQHVFLGVDNLISEEALAAFPGEQVVLKIVSPDVVHKSDVKGVVFCPKRFETVRHEIDRLIAVHRARGAKVDGVLVVEFVERGGQGLGEELFVGIRATREFGPVVAAGLGGVDTEYLARAMKPGVAVAKAVATETSAEEFFDLFKQTAAYEMISGQARGHRRIVSDGELLRCFRAFIGLARRFCVDRGVSGPDMAELEVNPFAFRRQHMTPLDGRGRLATATLRPRPRPVEQIAAMLEPRSIAVLGVSNKGQNFGRIILKNIAASGFDASALRVVKEGVDQVDGLACVPNIAALPGETDLLVIAAAAGQLPDIVDECIASGRVRSAIVIPGGAGETQESRDIPTRIRDSLARAREQGKGTPVLLGPNCLGVQSRPGRYDTFFIPENKLDKRRGAGAGRGVALLSQSGAFIITRLSNLETLDPLLTVSLGNQVDLTVSDLLRSVGARDDIHTLGVYVEGFNDLDGLDVLQAVRAVTEAGRTVVFYKAGRTDQGRDAAAGHTASVAGDYDICEAGATSAGALVADTFAEFEQLLELSAALHDRRVRGTRLGAISNAGFETVGMADRIRGPKYEVRLPTLPDATRAQIAAVMEKNRLAGLVNVRNPLDLTPMAGESAYEGAARALLECDEIDAILVSAVPLTPALTATAEELAGHESLADVLARLAAGSDKPIAAIIDSGSVYLPFVRRLREVGIPVFRSADQAMRSFGRYLAHHARPDRPTIDTKVRAVAAVETH
ncbi:MAG: indolepyruvate oxidoreductase subunit beta [Phycisphaerales bacterium]|jgi:indolepyruvate ferredoxin oxidoreductase beta subunit|nr:indolepyruvate oxidoreductase subunit beta [Phycisphaerales bacterium]